MPSVDVEREQFYFMVKEGLRPNDYFLDINNQDMKFDSIIMSYLAVGHYYGLVKSRQIIESAKNDSTVNVVNKKGRKLFDEHKPVFIVNNDFKLGCDYLTFDYMIVRNIFNGSTDEKVKQRCNNLRWHMKSVGQCYFFIDNDDSLDAIINTLLMGWRVMSLGYQDCFSQIVIRAKII